MGLITNSRKPNLTVYDDKDYWESERVAELAVDSFRSSRKATSGSRSTRRSSSDSASTSMSHRVRLRMNTRR